MSWSASIGHMSYSMFQYTGTCVATNMILLPIHGSSTFQHIQQSKNCDVVPLFSGIVLDLPVYKFFLSGKLDHPVGPILHSALFWTSLLLVLLPLSLPYLPSLPSLFAFLLLGNSHFPQIPKLFSETF